MAGLLAELSSEHVTICFLSASMIQMLNSTWNPSSSSRPSWFVTAACKYCCNTEFKVASGK